MFEDFPKGPRKPEAPEADPQDSDDAEASDGPAGPRPRAQFAPADILDDGDDPLAELMEALGERAREEGKGIRVYLFRLGSGGQKFLTTYPSEDFDLITVQRDHGGGRFLARFKVGGKWARGGATFEIAGTPKDPRDDGDDATGTDAPTETVAALAALTRNLEAAIRELRNPPPQAASQSPMDLALSVIGGFTTMLKPYQDALLADKKGGGGSYRDLMDAFLQGIELGREQSGPPESFAGVVRELMPEFRQAMSGAQAAGILPRLPAPEAPANVPGWVVWMRPYVPHLVRWAQARKDPGSRADIILDEVPADILPRFLDLIRQGEAFTVQLLTHFPELAPYRSWVEAVLVEISNSFEYVTNEDPEDDGEGSGTE